MNNLLVHSPDDNSSQDCTRWKQGATDSVQLPPMRSRDPRTSVLICHLPDTHYQETETKSNPRFHPRYSSLGCRYPKWGFTLYHKPTHVCWLYSNTMSFHRTDLSVCRYWYLRTLKPLPHAYQRRLSEFLP